MRQFNLTKWYLSFFIGINTLIPATLQAIPEETPPPLNQVEVVDTSFNDLKIKRLGEPIQVRYSFRHQKKAEKAEDVDVYIAYSPSQGGKLLFLQPNRFTEQALPYYTNLSTAKEETILELTLPGDINLVGEHSFYAALIKSGSDLSGLEVTQWPWEELSMDGVYVSR